MAVPKNLRILRMFLAATLVAAATTPCSATSKPPQLPSINDDVTTVRTMAAFDITSIHPEEGKSWVVAHVVPDYNKSIFIVRSLGIEGRNGAVVRKPDEVDVMHLGGTITISHVLCGTLQAGTRKYDWDIPASLQRTMNDRDTPFAKFGKFAGTCLVHQTDNESGPNGSLPYVPLPQEWAPHLPAAYARIEQQLDAFDPARFDTMRAVVEPLLGDPNPLVANAAFSTIVKAGKLTRENVVTSLGRTARLEEAVSLVLIGSQHSEIDRESLLADIGRMIGETQDVERLQGIALGALVCLRDRARPTSLLGFAILSHIESQARLENNRCNDVYIRRVLQSASLDILRHSRIYNPQIQVMH